MRKTCIGLPGEIIKFSYREKMYIATTEIVVQFCDLYCIGLAKLDWTERSAFFADKLATGEIKEWNNE